jgi:hypothetical protein
MAHGSSPVSRRCAQRTNKAHWTVAEESVLAAAFKVFFGQHGDDEAQFDFTQLAVGIPSKSDVQLRNMCAPSWPVHGSADVGARGVAAASPTAPPSIYDDTSRG